MIYLYLTQNDLSRAFEQVRTHYAKYEEVPHYLDETLGMQKLLGVLEKVRMDVFYPALLDKAAYLFIAINKGHFFSNGNKRLALVMALGFLALNDKRPQRLARERYKKKLKDLFGAVSFEEYSDFDSEEFAFYHLSLIVAESHRYISDDFDALKQKVRDFFAFSVEE